MQTEMSTSSSATAIQTPAEACLQTSSHEISTARNRLTESNSVETLPILPTRSCAFPPNSWRGRGCFKSWIPDRGLYRRSIASLRKFSSFIGPGFMISVAYIDPGNYATDIQAGATYRYSLLFIVLLANLFSIFLQSLAIKLGTITGLNLAEACRAYLPRWLNYVLYGLAEIAIVATDISEVIGFAIALNLLAPAVPLVAGCAISILDVLIILTFYRPDGPLKTLRIFELGIIFLVLAVVACFCAELSLIRNTTASEVLSGFLPSNTIFQPKGLYQACGIMGATVMPHSLYLGSGIVQPRLRAFDENLGLISIDSFRLSESASTNGDSEKIQYLPSIEAVRHSLKVSIMELAIALFTFALFVNAAILIVAAACLYGTADAEDADIFVLHHLISTSISPLAGTVFALALLLSGVSAGIVCTTAGQMVSEGALNWTVRPWIRRLVTRSISIAPSLIVAAVVGRGGLNNALSATQVVLSVTLPFVTAPLIIFTCMNKFMTIRASDRRSGASSVTTRDPDNGLGSVVLSAPVPLSAIQHRPSITGRRLDDACIKMANSWYTTVVATGIWLFLAIMNVANLVFLARAA